MATRTLPLPTPSLLSPSSSSSSPLSRGQCPRAGVPSVPPKVSPVPKSCQGPRKSFPNEVVKVKVKVNVSLTPGTNFYARSRQRSSQGSGFLLRSPGSGSQMRSQGFRGRDRFLGLGPRGDRASVTYSLRPLTSVESIHTLRFKHHHSATSYLQYVSAINKNYVTSCEFPNIPSFMLSSANSKRDNLAQDSGAMDTTRSTNSDHQPAASPKQEAEVEELHPENAPGRSEDLGAFSTPSLTPRPRSLQVQSASVEERESSMLKTASPDVRAEGRWLKRDRHAHVRLFPPVSPFRNSGTEGSSVRQHGRGENQKLVHSARHTPLTEQPQHAPSTTTWLREATMYDLNDQGPLNRPLEGVLPPPDRKAHSRHRRRSPEKKKKDRVHRLPENHDCLLVVTPREKKVKNERTV